MGWLVRHKTQQIKHRCKSSYKQARLRNKTHVSSYKQRSQPEKQISYNGNIIKPFLFTVEYYSTLIILAQVYDQDLNNEAKN